MNKFLDYSIEDLKNININNLNEDELNELKEAKEYFQQLVNENFNQEQAVKVVLNSIYGAFGNEYFRFFDVNIAESITKQGKNALLFSEKVLNEYFINHWHKDYDLHEKMNIKVNDTINDPVVIYQDTDSEYIELKQVLSTTDWEGDSRDFVLKLYDLKLKTLIEKSLEKYAEKWNTENLLQLELESIAYSGIWISKKKYIQNMAWVDPGIKYNSLEKIKTIGLENIQSSTPRFVRGIIDDFFKFIFQYEKLSISDVTNKIKEYKKSFEFAPIEDISFSEKINYYDKYVLDDYNKIKLEKGALINVQASVHHNYLLKNSKFKNKYRLIKTGDKIRWYYSKSNITSPFGFISGDHPYEFAPDVDYDVQFNKTFLDPVNRVLKVLGMKELNSNLMIEHSLF